MEELRRRGQGAQTADTKPKLENDLPRKSQRAGPRFKMEWDLIFWLFASFAVLYFSNFASHLLFDSVVRRWWLFGAVSAIVVCMGCLIYANKHHPSLDTTNWQQQAPALVAMATISALTGIASLWVAIWPVWRFYTFLMVPTLFMGFVSTISLFNL